MFISKKKFNEAIKQAKEDVYMEMGRRNHEKEREDYIATRFNDVNMRLNNAFVDIDNRLSALESQNSGKYPVPMKY